MIHPDHHHAAFLLRGADDPLRTGRRERQRLLDQHVQVGAQRREDVAFVEVVRCADDDRVEFRGTEHFLDVVVGVRGLEPVGQ